MKPTLVLLAVIGAFSLSPALAQNAPTTPPPSGTAAPAMMTKEHSPQSIECSKEADTKGLHGADRKKFRKDCMKKAKGAGSMNKQDVD